MKLVKTTFAAALAATCLAAALTAPAVAAEDFRLPERCDVPAADTAAAGHGAMHGGAADDAGDGMGQDMAQGMGHGMGHDMGGHGSHPAGETAQPEHVAENLRRMMITMPAMEAGMKIEDADIAFACAMIAHHQGAIDMAEVLLAHGEDAEMRALAEEIIAAQQPEIDRMTAWLAKQPR